MWREGKAEGEMEVVGGEARWREGRGVPGVKLRNWFFVF